MRKSILLLIFLVCQNVFAYDVVIKSEDGVTYKSIGTYNGYPLYEVMGDYMDLYSSYGRYNTVDLDGTEIAAVATTDDAQRFQYWRFTFSKWNIKAGQIYCINLRVWRGFGQYTAVGQCYFRYYPATTDGTILKSHTPQTLYIYSSTPKRWESSRDGGITWTVINCVNTKYTESNPAKGAVKYRILNGDGSYSKILNIIYVDAIPSKIVSLPATSVKTVDESITFSMPDLTDDGYTYQWKKDGTNISGATKSTYTISKIKSSHAGRYTCYVDNVASHTTSTNAELTVNKCPQTIDFPELAAHTIGDADFSLPEKTNKGLTINYQSTNTNVATISGNVVKIVAPGETNIIATQLGDANYLEAAYVTRKLVVNKKSQIIPFDNIARKTYEDQPFTLPAKTSEGLTISYESINPEVATVSQNVVTIIGAGTTDIVARQEGDATHYAAASVTRTLVVDKQKQVINFGAMAPRIYGDAPIVLNQSTNKGLTISYASDNTAIASIEGNNVVIKHPGTAVITATQTGNKNYLAADTVKQTLTIMKGQQKILLANIPDKVYSDAPFTLDEKTDKGLAIAYTSDNEQVAKTNGNTITIVGVGTANITASQSGDEYYEAATSVTLPFVVNKAYQVISFKSLPECTYGVGDIELFAATSDNNTRVYFESSDEGVAKINGNVANVVGAGSCYITAYADGNDNYYSATPVQQKLIVNKAGQVVSFPMVADKVYGDADFVLQATSNRGLPIKYTSSSPSKVSISGDKASIRGAGTVIITATQEGTTNYNSAAEQISITINKANLVVSADNKTKKYGEENPDFTISYNGFVNGDSYMELDNKPVGFCSATAKSNVGNYSITINPVEDRNYLLNYREGILTIDKAVLKVKADDAQKTYGDENPPLTVSYSGFKNGEGLEELLRKASAYTNAKSMSNAGTYEIMAEGAEARNYSFEYVSGILLINKAPLSVTLQDATREYGLQNEFAINFSGFKGDDTKSDLDALPYVKTDCTIESWTGSYETSLEGGADNNYTYDFGDNNHKLIVTKAPLTITADNQYKCVTDDMLPVLTMSFEGFRNNDTKDGLDKWPTISCNATNTSEAGEYVISLKGGSDKNYEYTLKDGVLTIGYKPSAIENLEFRDVDIRREGNNVIVTSDKNAPLSIFTVEGLLVYQGVVRKEQSIVLSKGIYIVRVGNRTKTMRI